MNARRLLTASDYITIRHRLDHPQVVVWDGCAETLAEDDDEWPMSAKANLHHGSARSIGRWILAVSVSALPWFEEKHPHDAPRAALAKAAAWLSGDRVSEMEFTALAGEARWCQDNMDSEDGKAAFSAGSARACARLFAEMVASESKGSSIDLRLGYDAVDFAISAAVSDATPIYGPLQSWRNRGAVLAFMSQWWSRCRALVPILDVATAEIEWGDIELPPKPINGDLRGDGSPGCIEWT